MKKENQLLARLGRLVGVETKPEAKKEEVNENLTVTVDATVFQAELENIRTEFETFKADANAILEQSEAEKKELQAKLDEALASLSDVQDVLAKAEEAKVAAEKLAHDTKMAARKAVVVAAIGEEKADAFLAATEMLDDTAFNAVSSALAGSVAAEANTALFKEVGVEAKADVTTLPEEKSAEMKILEAKYLKAAQPAK